MIHRDYLHYCIVARYSTVQSRASIVLHEQEHKGLNKCFCVPLAFVLLTLQHRRNIKENSVSSRYITAAAPMNVLETLYVLYVEHDFTL